jgi:hypothetical protein
MGQYFDGSIVAAVFFKCIDLLLVLVEDPCLASQYQVKGVDLFLGVGIDSLAGLQFFYLEHAGNFVFLFLRPRDLAVFHKAEVF